MVNRKTILLLILSVLLIGLMGGQGETMAREIVDLNGNRVKLPPVEELKRVVIISPPITSIFFSVLNDPGKVVAIHPRAISNANPLVLKQAFPNLQDLNTTFVKGFNVDIEAILKLEPDIIFYYGQQQSKKLELLQIPMVDFMKRKDRNPLTVTVAWERLMAEVFATEANYSIEKEWEDINQRLAQFSGILPENKLKGMLIFNNSGGKVMVSGNNTYGDYWLEMSGLVNVADDLSGEKEVSMEQIYQWNPDIIYIFMGEPAINYINGIKGQNWAMVKAVQEQRVYDVPKGMFSWAAPCADSPLMVQWMVTKNYPTLFPAELFEKQLRSYYQNHYQLTLSEQMIRSILGPKQESEEGNE